MKIESGFWYVSYDYGETWGYSPGTDGKEDGILNVVDDGVVPSTIDLRIIYPGAALKYLKTPLQPYVPPVW